MSTGEHSFHVEVTAAGIPQDWMPRMNRVVVEDGSNLPAVASVSFEDPDGLFFTKATVKWGAELTVKVKVNSTPSPVRLFTGEVVTFRMEKDGTGTCATIYASDLSARLMRGNKVVAFRNKKASDIAREIAGKAKIPLGDIDATQLVYEARDQVDVSDWDHLQELARENGREIAMVDGRFCFRKPVRAATAPGPTASAEQIPNVVDLNANVLSFQATATSVDQVTSVSVSGWDSKLKQQVTRKVTTKSSDEQSLGLTPVQAATAFGTTELLVTGAPYHTAAEVNAAAAAAADDVTAAFADVEAVIRGTPQMRTGMSFRLRNAGKPFDGRYTISSSRHTIVPKVFYETVVVSNGGVDRSPYGLTGGDGSAARPGELAGCTTGIVTNIKAGTERGDRHPERKDQPWVKLRFPMLNVPAGYESDWAPVTQAGGGGAGGGGVFCPEVNDAVIVSFEHGRLDQPVVVGSGYNGVDKPSPHASPLVDRRAGRLNRRSLGWRNMLVEFWRAKSPGLSGLRLRLPANRQYIFLDEGNKVLAIVSRDRIQIESRQNIMIKGKDITLDASGTLALNGTRVTVDGRTGVDVQGRSITMH